MGTPDPDYRIDPERTVYIVGDFDQTLLASIIPRIVELRADSDKPIGIVIDSDGGSMDCLEAIKSALCVLSPDGAQSRVVTYVTGHAASAGAFLLALGDYAIATPSSWVHFHGIRTVLDTAVRMEDASQIAQRLLRDNSRIATELTWVMFGRAVHRFARLKSDMARSDLPKDMPFIERYALLASERMSPLGGQYLRRALKKLATAKQLSADTAKLNFGAKESRASRDLKILKLVAMRHQKLSRDSNWHLSQYNLGQVLTDYFHLLEYGSQKHQSYLSRIIQLYGQEFLDDSQLKQFKSVRARAKRIQYLDTQVRQLLGDFWHFTSGVVEQLVYGENRLSAIDSYWLGAVDEVQGDPRHYGLRQLVESGGIASPRKKRTR